MRKTSRRNRCKCKYCGEEFMSSRSEYCSPKCHRLGLSRDNSELIEGIENIDYVICKWCGMKVIRLRGMHIKNHHPGKTLDAYRLEFPDAQLNTRQDRMNTAKAFIKYTTSDRGRTELSERIKGENNPNSKKNTSEETRKCRSPFSKSFYTKNGYTDEEAKLLVSEFANSALKDRLTETQLEYWLEKTDGDIEKAKILHRERQSTFTLEKCISRYGEESGRKRWIDRQDKWKDAIYKDDTCIACGTSVISREMFSKLNINDAYLEFFLRDSDKCFVYDFRSKNKIIEFNGDFWHCNPLKYESAFFHPIKKSFAQDIWNYDERKEIFAKSRGYKYLVVWESEYKNDPNGIIEKCKQFLNEEISS